MPASPVMCRWRTLVLLLLATLAAPWTLGCQAQPSSPALAASDATGAAAPVTQALVKSLARSEAMQGRTEASPAWVIAVDRVRYVGARAGNRQREKAVFDRLRTSPAVQQMRARYNVRFVSSPEVEEGPAHRSASKPEGQGSPLATPPATQPARPTGSGDSPRPTHSLTITFRPLGPVLSNPTQRMYRGRFSLMDLRTGKPVWAKRVRIAHPGSPEQVKRARAISQIDRP